MNKSKRCAALKSQLAVLYRYETFDFLFDFQSGDSLMRFITSDLSSLKDIHVLYIQYLTKMPENLRF